MIFFNGWKKEKEAGLQQTNDIITKIEEMEKIFMASITDSIEYSDIIIKFFYSLGIAQEFICQELKSAGIDIDYEKILRKSRDFCDINWRNIKDAGDKRGQEYRNLFNDLHKFINKKQ